MYFIKINPMFQIFTIFNDAPQNWQYGFQDSATPGFTGIVELHDTIFFYLIIISVGVFWVLGNIIYTFNSSRSSLVYKYLNHGILICLDTFFIVVWFFNFYFRSGLNAHSNVNLSKVRKEQKVYVNTEKIEKWTLTKSAVASLAVALALAVEGATTNYRLPEIIQTTV